MWKRIFRPKSKVPQYITIVSGLPRSGTSMMMRMLEAGGLEVIVDNIRKPDEDNPNGYYEFEKVKKIKADASFLDDSHGKAFKMVSMLLYDLPGNKKYKIIFMKRNIDEVLASQDLMLQRLEKKPKQGENEEMKSNLESHIAEISLWLSGKNNIDVIYINYNNIMKNAFDNIKEINKFLDNRLNVNNMMNVIDSKLYRNKITNS